MNSAPATRRELFGHPVGLYICFFTEMWERFSFYGMKALLFFYLTKYHLFKDTPSYDLIGAYGGLVYAVPVIGGMLADRFLGTRRAVLFGGSLLVLGHLGMAWEGHPASVVDGVVVQDGTALQVFYLSLALIIMGVGFLKPNISTIVGKLYGDNDPRSESGFTIFYAGINVGALLAGAVCGYLGETWGWSWGFGAAGVGMVLGLVVFAWGQQFLEGHAESSNPEGLRRRVLGPLTTEYAIYLGALGGVAVVWQLIQHTGTVHNAMHVVTAILFTWFVWFVAVKCTPTQRKQMIALLILIIACLLFFSLYEQTYGSWLSFTDRMMTRRVLWFDMSPSQSTSIGALFIVALSPVFAWLWPFLDKRGRNPSKPVKSVLGLALGGIAFVPLVIAAGAVSETAKANVGWLFLAYFVLEVGESCLSPIGLAAVSELSVKSVVALMMGTWFLATAYSEVIAASFSALTSLDGLENAPITAAADKYGSSFQSMVWLGLAAAALYLALTPLLKRWMAADQRSA